MMEPWPLVFIRGATALIPSIGRVCQAFCVNSILKRLLRSCSEYQDVVPM